jgi:hypothetical protein
MKKLLLAIVFFAALTLSTQAENNSFRGRFNAFYYDLKPYGYWMEIDNVIVWKPGRVQSDWQPYTYGRWVNSSYGWLWDSDEPYGDVVFHYGRWFYDSYEGWVWVPGYEWAPAWVEWRYDNDYIGWAPLSPYALYSQNYGISLSINYVLPYNHWRYVRMIDFNRYDIYSYYFYGNDAERFYNRTKSFSNYKYRDRAINEGVDPRFIEKRGGGNARVRDIEFGDSKSRDNNRADGNVKIRNIDFNRDADKANDKIEITKTRNTGGLKADKIDESARNTTREIKRNDNTPVVRDNNAGKREVNKTDNTPVVRDNNAGKREVNKTDNKPVVKDNNAGKREVKKETPAPKRENTARETPKRETTPRNTEKSSGGSSGSKERKTR